jgi:H+-transporting ATPase
MSAATQSAAAPPSRAAHGTDLETMPIAQVLARLDVTADKGLTEDAVRKRLAQYGPNALSEPHTSLVRKVLRHFTGPMAYMIEAAAIVSALLGRWDDFVIIAGLLFFNAGLEFWQDVKASNALAALKKGLALKATTLRTANTRPSTPQPWCRATSRTSASA